MPVGMLQTCAWSSAVGGKVGMDGMEPSNPSPCCIPRNAGGRLVCIACGGEAQELAEGDRADPAEPRAGREQLHEVAAGPLFPAWRDFCSRRQLSRSWRRPQQPCSVQRF